jgi:hypothetical protein
MAQQLVNDLGSNLEENLERWAKMLRHGGKNTKVFQAIYSSKKKAWTTLDIAKKTGLTTKAASEGAKALLDKGLLIQVVGKPLRYSKRHDVYREKRRLLTLAGNPKKLAELPTKRRPQGQAAANAAVGFMRGRAIRITVDEIDSFTKVRRIDQENIPVQLSPARLPEDVFKKGLEAIIGEKSGLKDWGGEFLDLYTTHLVIKGKRVAAGVALKGPAKTGPLTPAKMGKNGDQIQRLMSQSIEVAIVQYEGDVAGSVPYQMEKLAREKARSEDKNIYFCVIDLVDSYRLRLAYPKAFGA